MIAAVAVLSGPAYPQTEIRKQAPASAVESIHAKGAAAGAAVAPATGPVTTIAPKIAVGAMAVGERNGMTILQLKVAGTGRLRIYALASPDRVVIEGEGLGFTPELAASTLPPGRVLTDFRYGALENGDGRLVLDAARPVRLVVASFAGDHATMELAHDGLRIGDEPRILDVGPAVTAARAPTAPAAWAAPTVSKRMPVIMIDPGHGGKDPGAVTETGLYEKVVVLAVAQRLAAALGTRGAYDVRMTRDGDQSVPLDRRVQLAQSARADLFLSLHADTFAGQPQAASVRGGAIYVLADRASSRLAETLALRENAADKRLGAEAQIATQDPAVGAFLSDLTERETRTFAAAAQTSLVRSLGRVMQLARDPARGAAFRVLRQADTPAVLIELGYMSHAEDVVRLQAPDWQQQVADAIARAVDSYFAAPRSAVSNR